MTQYYRNGKRYKRTLQKANAILVLLVILFAPFAIVSEYFRKK